MLGINISGQSILQVVVWGFVFIVFALGVTASVIAFVIKKQEKKVIEIDIATHRMRQYPGRYKKYKKTGLKQFWARKIGKFLPKFQGKDIYPYKNKDALILLKDSNGLYHPLRVPTFEEVKDWYALRYHKDLESLKQEDVENIYLLPNPHEDTDWLASKIVESDAEFKNLHWWQHPNFMIIGTAFVCFMMVTVIIIFGGKL